MTDKAKSNLLKYLVGDMPQQTGINEPQFINDKILNNHIKSDLTLKLQDLGYETQSPNILGKIYDENNSSWLVYGYFVYTHIYQGFIYIVDNNLNFKALITKFDSGADLFPIVSMNKDEDNNYYALSNSIQSSPYTSRILLLNNIIGSGAKNGDYYCKIRKSYMLPINTSLYFYRQNRIIKVPNEAIYYIICVDESQATITTVLKFTINIESGNTWDTYRLSKRIDSIIFDARVKKTNDIEFYIYGISVEASPRYYEFSIIGENINTVKNIALTNRYSTFITQVKVYDDNNIYLLYADSTNHITYLEKLNNDSFATLKSWNWTFVDEAYVNPIITLENINNILFLRSAITNAEYITDLSIAIVDDTTIYEHSLGTTEGFSYNNEYVYNEFYITNSYNLYNIIVPKDSGDRTSYKTQLVYNEVNYNGKEYINTNSLIPKSGIIESEDKSEVLFARNIYNKTVNANTTTTTVQIPNTLLNDIEITNKSLISETNSTINENNESIITNIYETLYLNFINTITIQNQNDIDNIIVNQNGANRLNSSSTNLLDYQNAKATKIRYNYTDGTSAITIPTIELISNAKYTYKITIVVSKQINTIDILSEDENTIYQTIDASNLIVGKTYNLKQDVRVDIPLVSENLLYNNDEVLYNNENVIIGG